MGLLYRDKDGNETPIAGTQVTGELVPSISHYQEKTITATLSAGASSRLQVVFDTAMPDADYIANVATRGGIEELSAFVDSYQKTASGCYVVVKNFGDTSASVTIVVQAFKLMTEQSYQLDSNQIATNKTNIANLQTTNFVNYSLNAFEPISDTTHIANWTMCVTRGYLVEQGATIPSTLVGGWFNIINWQSGHFQSQIWVNEAGYTWSRFRYRAGGQSAPWSGFQRLDNQEIKEIDTVQDWSGLLQATSNSGTYTFGDPYVRAKRFGNHWEVFGRFRVEVTPTNTQDKVQLGYKLTGKNWNVLTDNVIVRSRSDSEKLYSWAGDLYVGMKNATFLANTTYSIVVSFTGLVE